MICMDCVTGIVLVRFSCLSRAFANAVFDTGSLSLKYLTCVIRYAAVD